jgi:multiple sugar transport system permease protein
LAVGDEQGLSRRKMIVAVQDIRARRSFKLTRPGTLKWREAVVCYLFIAPGVLGFFIFTLGPLIASLVMSLMEYGVVTQPRFIGLENWRILFTRDPLIWQSLRVTTFYAVGAVVLGITCALLLAILMNQRIFGIYLFRTIYYMPSVISGVPVALLWLWIFNPSFGVLNTALGWFGIAGPNWLYDRFWVIPAFILMSLWGVGGGMVIFLAGLQGIPQHLYEAAELDGAGILSKFRHITLPMLSPIILFNVVLGIISSFQNFTQAFIMTGGGPANASLLYVLYLYRNAFQYFKMGYASAMAWLLFILVLALTLVVFRSSALWVYYEGAERE